MSKKEIKIVEIFNKNGYHYVRLSHGSYEMIYRAARGVYWDKDSASLYFKGDTTRENALRIITESMKEEYGVTLIFN